MKIILEKEVLEIELEKSKVQVNHLIDGAIDGLFSIDYAENMILKHFSNSKYAIKKLENARLIIECEPTRS